MAESTLYPGFSNPLLGSPRQDLPRHVAIVGAGTIGPDIGYYLKAALPDITLTLLDVAAEPLQASETRYAEYAAKSVKRGKMKPEMAERVLSGIVYTQDYNTISTADLVIEAATESIPLKKKIFALIEERVTPSTIIVSNTSSIPAEIIFADMRYPERTTVTHFFAPAWRNPAVEVITWEGADRATVDYLRWLFAVTGKTPLVTADVVCFMLDRIFDNWVNESGWCLPFATAKQVDKVAEEFAAAGPFWVVDMSNGNPIIVETNTRQMEAEGECYRPAHLFNSVLRWVVGKRGEVLDIPEDVRGRVRTRLLGILFSQSLDIVARKIGTPADLELGCLQALGFKQGPFALMEGLGNEGVGEVLRAFEAERPGFPGLQYLPRLSELLDFPRFILVDRADDVIIVTIRRPAQLNALTDLVNDEILAVLRQYQDDPAVSGFVLTGYGTRAFCAGADIGRFPEMLGDAAASAKYARDSSRLLEYMDTMTKPVVAAVNGLALGGGAELALRCHDRVATSRAVFQFPEVTLGILPGIGGLIIPYRKWPAAAECFTRMLAQNDRLTAKEALGLGVISSLEDDYQHLVDAAVARARGLAGGVPAAPPDLSVLSAAAIPDLEAVAADGTPLSTEVVGIILQAVREGIATPDLSAALEVGYLAFGRVAATRAAAEGIGAFLAGRTPDYAGM